jgi:hypothetical protein
MLLLLACGIGIYLGLNFGVLVLLPLSFIGAGIFLVSFYSGSELSDAFGGVLLPLFSTQVAYMLGLTARSTFGQVLRRLNVVQSSRI